MRKDYGRLAYCRRKSRNQYLLYRFPICNICNSAPSMEVDHIIPLHKGGTEYPTNLQCLCTNCHLEKTKKELSKLNRASFKDDMESPKASRVIRRHK